MRIFQIGDHFPWELLSVSEECSGSSMGRGKKVLCSLASEHDGHHVAVDAASRPELAGTADGGDLVDFWEEAALSSLTVVGTWPAA